MKWLEINKPISKLLLISISCIGATGCYHYAEKDITAGDERPFYEERVVTVRITMSEEDWKSSRTNAMSKQYVKADLWFDGELIRDIGVRPKGNSSLMTAASMGTPRLSLKVDFGYFNPGHSLFGIEELNFNNGFSDPTLIREFLAYEIFRQMGVPSPRASFVDLWVNDTRLGLYTMVEEVDKTFLGKHFVDDTGNLYKPEMIASFLSWTKDDLDEQQSADGVTDPQGRADKTGIKLRGDKPAEIPQALPPEDSEGQQGISSPRFQPPGGMMLPGGRGLPQGFQPLEGFQLPDGFGPPPEDFVPPPGMGMPGMMGDMQGDLLEQMGLKTNEDKPDHSPLFRFLDILNNEPDATFPDEIKKVLDVDVVLRFLAVSTALVHLDNYIAMGHNYYLYKENGKFVIIPWDLNMAFGTFNSGLDRNQIINYYIDEPTVGTVESRPLVSRLLSHQPFLEAYHGYLEELLDGPFNVDRMSSRIDEITRLIWPFVSTDELKFFSTEDFERGLDKDLESSGTQRFRPGAISNIIGLKAFVRERNGSIRGQLDGIIKAGSGDGSGNPGGHGFPGAMPLMNLRHEPR